MKTETTIAKTIKHDAENLGLCGKWMDEWTPIDDATDLAARYVDGISFCLLHDFPKLDTIKQVYNSDKAACNKQGLYIDEKLCLTLSDSLDLVFRGKCTGRVVFHGIGLYFVYIMDDCDIEFESSGFSSVFVKTVGDKAKCTCTQKGYGKIKVREFRKEDISND